jgi:hypothetical protein
MGLAFLAVVALAFAAVLSSLGDKNMETFGSWLNDNLQEIGVGVLAVIPSVTTYLFGRRSGRTVGKTEAYNSAIATVANKPDTASAAEQLRQEARAHDLAVKV